jgi:hypothetical protein
MTFAELILSLATPVGRFDPERGCFELHRKVNALIGVYLFVERTANGWRIRRPGYSGNVGRRLSSDYKRWHLGNWHLDDPAEQAARMIMLHGLSRCEFEVWVLCFETPADPALRAALKTLAEAVESEVRAELGVKLDLDRSVRGSWANLAQAEWRRSGKLPGQSNK